MAGFNELCTPARVYFGISLIFILLTFAQNYGNANMYCLGSVSCDVSSMYVIFLIKVIYVLFWTWVLNLICKSGATPVAWFLVLIPFVMMFLMLAIMMATR